MKTSRILSYSVLTLLLYACSSTKNRTSDTNKIQAHLDLVNVPNDKVKVVVYPNSISRDTISFVMAKIIPGTYAIADYGRYLEEVTAYDATNNTLPIEKTSENTWLISGAKKLHRLSYLVNDTFDEEEDFNPFAENSTTIFSPAGTNILADKNFILNMSGFVGYFEGKANLPYDIQITHPQALLGVSALDDQDPSGDKDLFMTKNYAALVDSPIMYGPSKPSNFTIDDMEVILSVYAPENSRISAAAFLPDLQKMMAAQKHYLGDINDTKKYAVLNYITTMGAEDAKGIGALEHNYSTTGVFRESMTSQDLIDVISHEFFHTLTPLNIHSKEIQYFDFINPKMSAHLWMYEGFTEYFAQHFQVHENLKTEEEFYSTIMEKITASKNYDDNLSFTQMSKNVLEPKMKAQYPNVYQKGALMAMCMDIIIREKSNGERSLLSVMGELSKIYGPEKPFDDSELIPKFTAMTYPEIGDFIQKHIVQGAPVDYDSYLAQMGVSKAQMPVVQPIVFIVGPNFYAIPNADKTEFVATLGDGKNEFYKALDIQEGDVFVEINGAAINPGKKPLDQAVLNEFLTTGYKIPEGTPMTIKVKRNGETVTLSGKAVNNYAEGDGYIFTNTDKKEIKDKWLFH